MFEGPLKLSYREMPYCLYYGLSRKLSKPSPCVLASSGYDEFPSALSHVCTVGKVVSSCPSISTFVIGASVGHPDLIEEVRKANCL